MLGELEELPSSQKHEHIPETSEYAVLMMIQGTELPLLHRFEFQGLKYLMQIMVQSQHIYRIFFKKGEETQSER